MNNSVKYNPKKTAVDNAVTNDAIIRAAKTMKNSNFSVVNDLPAAKEQVDIIRRAAERGLDMAIINNDSRTVDIFQHILDELVILKGYINNDF
jgi:hypothetical protein